MNEAHQQQAATAYVGPVEGLAESVTDLMLVADKPVAAFRRALAMHGVAAPGGESPEVVAHDMVTRLRRVATANHWHASARKALLASVTATLHDLLGDVVAYVEPSPEHVLEELAAA